MNTVSNFAGPADPFGGSTFVSYAGPELDLYVVGVVKTVSRISCARVCAREETCVAFEVCLEIFLFELENDKLGCTRVWGQM